MNHVRRECYLGRQQFSHSVHSRTYSLGEGRIPLLNKQQDEFFINKSKEIFNIAPLKACKLEKILTVSYLNSTKKAQTKVFYENCFKISEHILYNKILKYGLF